MNELNQQKSQEQQGAQPSLLLDGEFFNPAAILFMAIAFIEMIMCSLFLWDVGLVELRQRTIVDGSAGTFDVTAFLSLPSIATMLAGVFLAFFACFRAKKEDNKVLFSYLRIAVVILILLAIFFIPVGELHTTGGAVNLVADESISLLSLLQFVLSA